MHLNHGKLELIYIPREPLSCPEQPRKAQWPAWHHCLPGGLRKTPSNRLNSPPPPLSPARKLPLDKAKKQEGGIGGSSWSSAGLGTGTTRGRRGEPVLGCPGWPGRPRRTAAPYLPHGEIPIIHPAGEGLLTLRCSRQRTNPSSFPP